MDDERRQEEAHHRGDGERQPVRQHVLGYASCARHQERFSGIPEKPMLSAVTAGGGPGSRSCGGKNPPQEIKGDVLYVAPQSSPVTPKPRQHVLVAEHAIAPAKTETGGCRARTHQTAGNAETRFCRLFPEEVSRSAQNGTGDTRWLPACGCSRCRKRNSETRAYLAVQAQLSQHHAVRICQVGEYAHAVS